MRNVCKNDNSSEYRVEYAVLNAKPGKYVCQIQSKCEFGVSEMSMETSVYKEEEVGLLLFTCYWIHYFVISCLIISFVR